VVGTEEEDFFRICVAGNNAALLASRLFHQIIKTRISSSDDADIVRPAPSPVAEVIEVDICHRVF